MATSDELVAHRNVMYGPGNDSSGHFQENAKHGEAQKCIVSPYVQVAQEIHL